MNKRELSLVGIVAVLFLSIAAGALFWGFQTIQPPATSGPAIPAEDAGLITQDTVVGTGAEVPPGFDAVRVTYTGSYLDGTVFDSNFSEVPYTFIPGSQNNLVGWEKGLIGMKVGGTRILTILPNYAERAQYADKFPIDATLVYQIKLMSIIEAEGEDFSPPPEPPPVQP